MCGIVGILKFDPRETIERARLTRMRDTLRHRGPDEEGVMIVGHVGFGHRRLSIIDLASGQQPMTNADRSVWITYNGEVYNFKELRADLESRRHVFQLLILNIHGGGRRQGRENFNGRSRDRANQ